MQIEGRISKQRFKRWGDEMKYQEFIENLLEQAKQEAAQYIAEHNIKLLPCPFCGNSLVTLDKMESQEFAWSVICGGAEFENDGCGASVGAWDNIALAIGGWQNRNQPGAE
jgi:hypothetical protein